MQQSRKSVGLEPHQDRERLVRVAASKKRDGHVVEQSAQVGERTFRMGRNLAQKPLEGGFREPGDLCGLGHRGDLGFEKRRPTATTEKASDEVEVERTGNGLPK